ncbi:hypothetical protein [Blastococcus sp. SYSU D00695]
MTGVPDLVRRRLWELRRTVDEASRRSRWTVPREVLERLSQGGEAFISEELARPLAAALDVPEQRLRRAAGLPPVPDPRAGIETRPDLRVVGRDL